MPAEHAARHCAGFFVLLACAGPAGVAIAMALILKHSLSICDTRYLDAGHISLNQGSLRLG